MPSVHESTVGVEAGVPAAIYSFSPAVTVLFEAGVIVPTVVEALKSARWVVVW